MKLIIPKPCSADWEQMTPCMKGRHCQLCDKTVVDFTQMNKIQIDSYILQNKGTEICGRFNKKQLIKPSHNLQRLLIRLYNKTNREFKAYLPKIIILFFISLAISITGCGSSKPKEIDPSEITLPAKHQSPSEMGKINVIETNDIKSLE